MPEASAVTAWLVVMGVASALAMTAAKADGKTATSAVPVDCNELNYDRMQNEAARTILLSLLMMQA